jgi:hypothetical protein
MTDPNMRESGSVAMKVVTCRLLIALLLRRALERALLSNQGASDPCERSLSAPRFPSMESCRHLRRLEGTSKFETSTPCCCWPVCLGMDHRPGLARFQIIQDLLRVTRCTKP